jgi:oxygen-dependent protoporphyrinogen oxidase
LAYPAEAIARSLDGSGFLVPRNSGLLMTACSWASSKFTHLGRDGIVRLRVSAGRWGDTRAGCLSAAELVTTIRHELAITMGIEAPPDEVRVSPWPRSLPQYTVGHLDRLSAVEEDVRSAGSGLAVTGAAFRGVGIPMGIHQGREATRSVLARLV